jgi:histidyl-tRNA synthetase
MSEPLQPPRGTKDLIGAEARAHRAIAATLADVCERYGAEPIETPIFEQLGVFARTLGDSSDVVAKEMYVFEDRGGDKMALRPEGTAGVARAFIHASLFDTLPRAFYYFGAMFRYERPQKGRQRQFHQAGVEFLGTTGALADAEAIACAARFLRHAGITAPLTLEINTLGTPPERLAYRAALVAYFTAHRDALSEDSLRRLESNPLRILDSKDAGDKALVCGAPAFADFLTAESAQYFRDVLACLNDSGALGTIELRHNPHLVRGLDYYNHTAFEFTTTALGAQATVLAGGRYDGLLASMGGKDAPGVGWAAGIERLALLQPESAAARPCLALCALDEVAASHVLKLAEQLRGLTAKPVQTLRGAKLGKLLEKASKRGADAAFILGSTEAAAGTVTVKDLRSGDQVSGDSAALNDWAAAFLTR